MIDCNICKHKEDYCIECKCGVIRPGKSKDNAIMLWNRRANDDIFDNAELLESEEK